MTSCQENREEFQGNPNEIDSLGRSLLQIAAQQGDLKQLNLLVKAGASLDTTDDQGDTALVHAVNADQLPAVTRLLQHGASAHVNQSRGGSLVVQALRHKRLAMTYLLLDNGARLHSRGVHGESLLQAAVEMGNLNLIRDLQERGAHPRSDLGNGHGLLHVSLDQEQWHVFDYLLAQGQSPDRKNEIGDLLVHRLVKAKQTGRLRALNAAGADFNLPDANGWLPLHLAIQARDPEVVRALLNGYAEVSFFSFDEKNPISPLELALSQNDLVIARQLLEAGASDEQDQLYQAVKRGGEEGRKIVDLLIEFDASMQPDRAGDCPLTLAVRQQDFAITRSLLGAGAPLDVLDPCGQKPFHLAVARGDLEIAELLLEAGADPNEPFRAEPSEEFLRFVNSQGVARWALKNSSSLKPLMVAADSGNIKLAQLLMKHGASPGKSAKVGKHRFWPLTFAARRQDVPMQQVLFGRGPERTKRWIKVDLSEQSLKLFEGDAVKLTSPISSGRKGNRTPVGKYVISNKYRTWKSTLYDSEMPYFQRLSGGDFGFHYGVLPGYPASHGCIRMPMKKVRQLFQLTSPGDYVEIVK